MFQLSGARCVAYQQPRSFQCNKSHRFLVKRNLQLQFQGSAWATGPKAYQRCLAHRNPTKLPKVKICFQDSVQKNSDLHPWRTSYALSRSHVSSWLLGWSSLLQGRQPDIPKTTTKPQTKSRKKAIEATRPNSSITWSSHVRL